jgi:hypothetical protein
MDKDLFGEAQKDSSTYGEWGQVITPQQSFPLKDGSATITIDQNHKVTHFPFYPTNCEH